MTCPSPTIPKEGSRKRRQSDGDSIKDVVIGFILDGVTSQENWTRDNGFVFEFFPDPNYEPFKDSELKFKHGMDTPLEILVCNFSFFGFTFMLLSHLFLCLARQMMSCWLMGEGRRVW